MRPTAPCEVSTPTPARLRPLLCLGAAALGLLSASSSAHAQEIGTRHNLVIAADRLFGVYVDKQSVDVGPTNADSNYTLLGLGWAQNPSTLLTPRVGIDFLLTDALTLGGTLGVFSINVDRAGRNQGRTTTGWLFGPRVGYLLRLSRAVSFWPRGGFTYTTVSFEGVNNDNHVLALSIDAPFTLAPGDGFALLIGPSFEVALLGKNNADSYSELAFGLTFGLAGWVGL